MIFTQTQRELVLALLRKELKEVNPGANTEIGPGLKVRIRDLKSLINLLSTEDKEIKLLKEKRASLKKSIPLEKDPEAKRKLKHELSTVQYLLETERNKR